MTSEIWTWACTQVLRVCTFIFGSAISFLGVATITLLVLLWIYTIVRLIVAPILGSARYHMIDNAMYGTAREIQREKTRANFRAVRQADRDMLERALSKRR